MTSESDATGRRLAALRAQSAGIAGLAAQVAAAPSLLPAPGAACWASEARNRYEERLVAVLHRLNAVRVVLDDGAAASAALAARLEEERAHLSAAEATTAEALAAFGLGSAAVHAGAWP
ncbi:hypothetical protein ARHIZOSPH14_15450 [Agromyces rhizosphaerae]|uniref:Uncharacterized protein n=1 Tax=Agromyces rhizosphaerae TaxID=88374 RepID=A0A9W6FRN7_9MICO|nr:hypothetical protein [Agromyces rhizosphaerae]GLI27303.1 hypothetical protein ARHIZOSPH14_15450 [Agromyces rhizosphaerae]